MNTWLFKSEPNVWGWDDQVARGEKGEHWDGVRNHQASNNMKAMKVGDRGFFYHSGDEKRIVGIVEVIREYYPDHTDPTGRFGMVDLKAVRPLKTPVTLRQVKDDPRLADLLLVKHSRLSVMPIPADAWRLICSLGGVEP